MLNFATPKALGTMSVEGGKGVAPTRAEGTLRGGNAAAEAIAQVVGTIAKSTGQNL